MSDPAIFQEISERMERRTWRKLGAAVAIAVALPGSATAQDYPTRDIRMINGYAAGAGADVSSRIVGKHLEESLGQPVIIDNRPGAFTNLAAAAVARAQPDGYTLLFSGHVTITSNIHLFKTTPFDPAKDFTAIAPAGKQSFAFAVPPQSPARNMGELVSHLKAKGDKASFGYANTLGLMNIELFKRITGAPAVGVPYKSSGDALTGLLRGDIDLLVYDLGSLTQQERDGRLRVLAVTSAERSPLRPDLPGMREAGVPDFDLGAWFGVWGPARMSAAIVNRISTTVDGIWRKPDRTTALAALAVEPFFLSPEEFAKFVQAESAKWGRVISITKIEPQ
jgi:tripartite-type tricarboxylate transporter receptor subunit TctC